MALARLSQKLRGIKPHQAQASAEKFDVVIVGGGCGGLSVGALLLLKNHNLNVAIIEPSTQHHYQPGWTLVGGGIGRSEEYVRPEQELIPEGAAWIQSKVTKFHPQENQVETHDGRKIGYDQLVVAAGLQTNWNAIKGLPEALQHYKETKVVSNYSHKYAPHTFELIWKHKGGTALFTMPTQPVKCAGAPQKIAYLADAFWQQSGVKQKTKSIYLCGIPSIFGQPDFAEVLTKIAAEKQIEVQTSMDLTEVRGDKREAVFTYLAGERKGETKVIPYDFLHVTPKQSAPDFIKASPLADATGFVDVNKSTLQHTKFSNVFSLGDCSNVPTSKTAAAVTSEYPVLVENLLAARAGRPLAAAYEGYTSCPIPVGNGRLLLAEFKGPGYGNTMDPSLWFNQKKPSKFAYFLKKNVFPTVYFESLLRGGWQGPQNSLLVSSVGTAGKAVRLAAENALKKIPV